MITLAEILKQANEIEQMSSVFSASYIAKVDAKPNSPCIAAPAVETRQGEQKIPVVKPNGVTR